jgi:drug/metabolite transporter (DMT)-like permease
MTALDAASATLRLRGTVMVACAAVCWSTGGLLQRLISADAWTTIFWRAVFAAVFLFAFVLWRDRGRGLGPFRDSGWAGFGVGFCFAAASSFYILSLSLTKVANTLIVLSTSPFLTALLAWVVLGEQVRIRTWIAMAAAIGGIDALVFTGGVGEGSAWVRAQAAARLDFLGIELDARRNAEAAADAVISPATARAAALVVESREDLQIAYEVRALLAR